MSLGLPGFHPRLWEHRGWRPLTTHPRFQGLGQPPISPLGAIAHIWVMAVWVQPAARSLVTGAAGRDPCRARLPGDGDVSSPRTGWLRGPAH